jgi:hypothetical protein
MDLRRLVNVAHAHLATDLTADGRKQLDADLSEPFEHELTERERKRLEYRRRAREIGADKGQQALMGAFNMPPAGKHA